MDITPELVDRGFAWTAARIAAVPPDRLDLPTPCSRWNLEELLDHTIESLTMLIAAVETSSTGGTVETSSTSDTDVTTLGPRRWDLAIATLAARNRRAWAAPGVMERTIVLPFAALPAPVAASTTLLEAVVHGWDIGQASGEAPAIPDDLAKTIFEFAPAVDENRVGNFAADLGIGDTPSERVVAYLGRKAL